jgi:hypothetical protein
MKVVRLVVRGRNSNKKQKKNRTGKGPNCWIYFLLILDRYFFSSRGWALKHGPAVWFHDVDGMHTGNRKKKIEHVPWLRLLQHTGRDTRGT